MVPSRMQVEGKGIIQLTARFGSEPASQKAKSERII
jgi:hypothetical protein